MAQHHALAVAELRVHCETVLPLVPQIDPSVPQPVFTITEKAPTTLPINRFAALVTIHSFTAQTAHCRGRGSGGSPIVTFLSVMFSYTKFSWAWHSAPQFSSCGQQMLHPPFGAHSRLLSAVQLFFHKLDFRIIFLPDCWAGPIQIANCSGASM